MHVWSTARIRAFICSSRQCAHGTHEFQGAHQHYAVLKSVSKLQVSFNTLRILRSAWGRSAPRARFAFYTSLGRLFRVYTYMIGLQMIGLDWKSQMIGWEPNDRIAACAVLSYICLRWQMPWPAASSIIHLKSWVMEVLHWLYIALNVKRTNIRRKFTWERI